jgi:hypothetical protein
MGLAKTIIISMVLIIVIYLLLSSLVYSQGKLIISSPMSLGHLLSLLNSNNAFNYYFIAGIVVFLFCVLYGIAHLSGDK